MDGVRIPNAIVFKLLKRSRPNRSNHVSPEPFDLPSLDYRAVSRRGVRQATDDASQRKHARDVDSVCHQKVYYQKCEYVTDDSDFHYHLTLKLTSSVSDVTFKRLKCGCMCISYICQGSTQCSCIEHIIPFVMLVTTCWQHSTVFPTTLIPECWRHNLASLGCV